MPSLVWVGGIRLSRITTSGASVAREASRSSALSTAATTWCPRPVSNSVSPAARQGRILGNGNPHAPVSPGSFPSKKAAA